MPSAFPRWIAHRGGGTLAPENTLAGIRLAAALGYRAVEFDVMLSGSGTPVLMHDETLERTTDGHGWLAHTDDAVLFTLDAGGEPVPRLDAALQACAALGLAANVEIKPASGCDVETAARTLAAIDRLAEPPPLLLSSFSLPALRVAQTLRPDLPRAWLLDTLPDDWRETAAGLGVVALHVGLSLVTPALVRDCAGAGLALRAYTVRTVDQAEALLAIGVDGLFIDPLDRFEPYRESQPDAGATPVAG